MLSPSNENVKETVFPVDCDVDSSLEIEVTMANMHQFVVRGEKYPRVQKIWLKKIFKTGKINIFRNTWQIDLLAKLEIKMC